MGRDGGLAKRDRADKGTEDRHGPDMGPIPIVCRVSIARNLLWLPDLEEQPRQPVGQTGHDEGRGPQGQGQPGLQLQ